MRFQGKISKWRDDKEYGFVMVNGEDETIFAHISAFAKGHHRPSVGELVTFEISRDAKKGPQAHNIDYVYKSNAQRTVKRESKKPFIISLAAIFVILVFGYFSAIKSSMPSVIRDSISEPISPVKSLAHFQCAGKTKCSQMISCEEAVLYLKNCPGTITDGDGDGIPCEDQWCGH